jgi:hypothetical protein
MQQRKVVWVLVFMAGALLGGILGAIGGFLPFYRYYFVDMDGPAGAISRQYSTLAANLVESVSGRARTPEEIVSRDALLAGTQSLLAAGAYCAMNEGNRAEARRSAVALRANPYVQDYLKTAGRESVKLSLDYLANASDTAANCTSFQPLVQRI